MRLERQGPNHSELRRTWEPEEDFERGATGTLDVPVPLEELKDNPEAGWSEV